MAQSTLNLWQSTGFRYNVFRACSRLIFFIAYAGICGSEIAIDATAPVIGCLSCSDLRW
jgi:hypothetical protein